MPSVRDVVSNGEVDIHFQPIVSLRRHSMLGVEALMRCPDGDGGYLSPRTLFADAAQAGLTLELDRICRTRALERFLPLREGNADLILFFNLTSAAMLQDAAAIAEEVQRVGLPAANVAIEVLEEPFEHLESVQKAVEAYRDAGFLLALDDMGSGHANLDRIIQCRPDILKTDLSLVRDLHSEFHKQEVFKALVHLSERIGGWVITEGVETEDEALAALDMGGDIFQGYYFSRPHAPSTDGLKCSWERLEQVAYRFRDYVVEVVARKQVLRAERATRARNVARKLACAGAGELAAALADAMTEHPCIQSGCVLDPSGRQITDTVMNGAAVLPQKQVIFRPPGAGADHSLKEYYYLLDGDGRTPFETLPYVPLPTARLCVTVSTRFRDSEGRPLILCLHMDTQEFSLLAPPVADGELRH